MIRTHNCFLTLLFVAVLGCENDDPDYPIEPFIEFESLAFVDNPNISETDTLKLAIRYRDGDGDLGLDLYNNTFPHQYLNFFLGKDGNVFPVSYTEVTYSNQPSLLLDLQGLNGELITVKARNEDYTFLPAYEAGCSAPYIISPIKAGSGRKHNIYVQVKDSGVLWQTNFAEQVEIGGVMAYLIADTMYVEKNTKAFNIFVDYLVEQPDGTFQEYDFEKELCTTWDGRFPEISALPKGHSVSGPFEIRKISRWKGSITFNMRSVGFKYLFSGKRLKLRVSIKDRAFHDSNVIETDVIQF